jgi:hypothetical protein
LLRRVTLRVTLPLLSAAASQVFEVAVDALLAPLLCVRAALGSACPRSTQAVDDVLSGTLFHRDVVSTIVDCCKVSAGLLAVPDAKAAGAGAGASAAATVATVSESAAASAATPPGTEAVKPAKQSRKRKSVATADAVVVAAAGDAATAGDGGGGDGDGDVGAATSAGIAGYQRRLFERLSQLVNGGSKCGAAVVSQLPALLQLFVQRRRHAVHADGTRGVAPWTRDAFRVLAELSVIALPDVVAAAAAESSDDSIRAARVACVEGLLSVTRATDVYAVSEDREPHPQLKFLTRVGDAAGLCGTMANDRDVAHLRSNPRELSARVGVCVQVRCTTFLPVSLPAPLLPAGATVDEPCTSFFVCLCVCV